MVEFQQGYYSIDGLPNESFPGYSDGDTWNGFACPYFEKTVAEQILTLSEKNGYRWNYDLDKDMFYVWSVDDPSDYSPNEFGRKEIVVNGMSLMVYGIGTFYWVWMQADTAS